MPKTTLKGHLRQAVQRAGIDVSRYRPEPTVEDRVADLARRQQITLMLDVGANSGVYAAAIRQGGYGGRILSFEPLRRVYVELQARVVATVTGIASGSLLEIAPKRQRSTLPRALRAPRCFRWKIWLSC